MRRLLRAALGLPDEHEVQMCDLALARVLGDLGQLEGAAVRLIDECGPAGTADGTARALAELQRILRSRGHEV